MKTLTQRILLALICLSSSFPLFAEDGSRLWLRSDASAHAIVTSNSTHQTVNIAIKELTTQWKSPSKVKLSISKNREIQKLGEDGFRITGKTNSEIAIQASSERGLLYGAYHLLRLQASSTLPTTLDISETPSYNLRLLNHWDNLDGRVERGYAGHSLWKWDELPAVISPRYEAYARANASIGINGTVLNNVNASPDILKNEYLNKIKILADVFRPYGIKVYLSVNFASPTVIGGLDTADPFNPEVFKWWQNKAKDIYSLIPDFGGFLVKANSEGQPGPQNFGRTHADGANMLADVLKPYNGIVMWRAFVYAPDSDDRAKQAYNEFMPLDGQFRDNVIIQVKNGPIDFQPREPFTSLFGAVQETAVMPELQVTQEYLGFSNHLVFLASMWREFLDSDTYCRGAGSTVAKTTDGSLFAHRYTAIAGVSNIGDDANWCGHQFAQANWYAFGRLAWDNTLSDAQIANEWLAQTFTANNEFRAPVKELMLASWEAAVNYMMPLGLHHIFAEGHHYGPQPWYDKAPRPDWTCTYYHKADAFGLGFDRTKNGSGAVAQYFPPLDKRYGDSATCPENLLLFFHHLPWNYRMKNGRILWDELCYRYDAGVKQVREFQVSWDKMAPYIDAERFTEVQAKLKIQARDAVWWKDACLLYFQSYSRLPIPYDIERPIHDIEQLKQFRLNLTIYEKCNATQLFSK